MLFFQDEGKVLHANSKKKSLKTYLMFDLLSSFIELNIIMDILYYWHNSRCRWRSEIEHLQKNIIVP